MSATNNPITVFAETTFRNQFKKFGIKADDRRRHMYVIGKTGMGKSTLMENMIIEDIRAGRGVAVVDPHGELAEKIIQFIPDHRVEDVVYFNPADTDHPIAFNIVEQVEPHLRHLVASGLIGVFKKLWADSWGPRLEYILRNAILAILDYPGSTLLAVTRMLADKNFRKRVVDCIQDPVVKAFWVKEFAGYQDKFASEAVAPIQNKVGQFLSSSLVRNIIGQSKSSIDIRRIMDEKKILIMNLSKGRIGEDNTQLLGAMMITKIQLAAMSRVDIPEHERNDFYLYVDEFQNFATDSFANILSEARKYRLNLIMGHQYIEQLSELVSSAVFGNVGTLVVYRVGATDAESLVKEFTPVFTAEDLVNIPKFNFCLKLMIDGVASDPFTARCLPPLASSELTGNDSVVINLSRQKYANEKEKVEQDIASWHEEDITPPKALVTDIDSQKSDAPVAKSASATSYAKPATSGFEAECSSCGKKTRLNFEPDGVRPVFCKECLAKSKEDRKSQLDSRREAKERELNKLKPANSTTLAKNHHSSPSSPKASSNYSGVTHKAAPVSYKPGNQNHYASPRASLNQTISQPASVKAPSPIHETPVADSGSELSLSDISSAPARDFRGRTLAVKEAKDSDKPLYESQS